MMRHVNSTDQCAYQAVAAGFDTFGLQYGGQCFGCLGCAYAAAGLATRCAPLGSGNSNQVYTIAYSQPTSTSYLGCFVDNSTAAVIPNEMYHVASAAECALQAAGHKYNFYGLQYLRRCFGCLNCNYSRLGVATNCPMNGGVGTNQVYKV